MASQPVTVRTAAATIKFNPGDEDSSSLASSTSSDDSLQIIIHPAQEHNILNNIRQNNSERKASVLNNNGCDSDINQQDSTKQSGTCDSTEQCDTEVPCTDTLLNPSPSPNKSGSPKRFNPFDKEEYDPNQKLFPHADGSSSSLSACLPLSGASSGSSSDSDMAIAEDHFALPEGHVGLSSVEELELAINNCKLMILESEEHSANRRNLVKKLVELRMKIAETKEGPEEMEEGMKLVLGHRFTPRGTGSRTKHYCECCNSVIWGVLHDWYRCTECGFCCHSKCLNVIKRTCASIKVAENPTYIINITPEKGLSHQNYCCAECKTPISFEESGQGEPRQCEYTGIYYCESCHWNDTMVLPALVLHNWDFEPRKVCRASKQFLKLMAGRAVIRVCDINPMLFSFVEELNDVKRLREEILLMKKYFLTCKTALETKLLLQLRDRQHFVEGSDLYSLQDLQDILDDVLLPILVKIHASFAQHIKTDCKRCQGQGYICELCDYEEVLFPFDNHALVCAQCSTVIHRHCYIQRDHRCPKCERINKRSKDSDAVP